MPAQFAGPEASPASSAPAGPEQLGSEHLAVTAIDMTGATPEAVGDLMARWQELETFASLPTQSAAFFAALSASLLCGAVIRGFNADGRAILPLCRDPGLLTRWRLAGVREVSEPGDALCADRSASRALARHMANERRPLSLARVPAGSPFVEDLKQAMRGRGLVSLRPAVPCPTIALDDSWSDAASRFNSGRRSDFRRAERRAAELGAVTYEVLCPDEDAFDALFAEAIAVELASWKQDAGTAIAVDPAKQAFFGSFFRAAAAAGTMRIAFMRIDGRAVAMQLALEWHGRFWLFKIGYDQEYSRCSPGTLLMLHTLGWAAERGLTAYELMGNVEAWIADFWTRDSHDCVNLRTYPFSLGGALALAADGLIWLRERLRPGSGKPAA